MNNQRGLALITVLLMVASVLVLAALMLERSSLVVDQLDLLSSHNRIKAAVMSAETQAVQQINESLQSSEFEFQDSELLKLSDVQQINGLEYRYKLVDSGAKLNVNNLSFDSQNAALWVQKLTQILTALEMDPELAYQIETQQLGAADPDLSQDQTQNPDPDQGQNQDQTQDQNQAAESAQSQAPINPYETALVDLEELLRIEDLSPDQLELLSNYLWALPFKTSLNPNTMPLDLSNALGLNPAPRFGFSSLSEAVSDPADQAGLALKADAYLLLTQVSQTNPVFAVSVIRLSGSSAYVQSRRIGGPDSFGLLKPELLHLQASDQ